MNFPKAILKCGAATLCAITLASCSGQGFLAPSAPDLNKQFTLTAHVTCGDSDFTADFTRSNTGKWQVTLTEPYEVQGVTFTYSAGKVSAGYGNLTADALTADFADSPPGLIISAFEDTVQDSSPSTSYQKEAYIVRSGSCTLTFAQDSGAPILMELPNLKAEISDFKITGDILPEKSDVIIVE